MNLSGNNIGSKGAILICEQVENCPWLRSLDLSRNYITKTAAEAIHGMLKVNDTLLELYLHWNQLKTDGALMVLEAIAEHNNSLRVFDLS